MNINESRQWRDFFESGALVWLRSMGPGLAGMILMLSLSIQAGSSQEADQPAVTLMFYNVENLFDIYNDSTRDDEAFLPGKEMGWIYSRYKAKINSVYKTIVAAGKWSPPELVAFCEIENRKVLEDLIYGTYLSKFNYAIIHEESPDRRGIDVCLIYNRDQVKVEDYAYWIPSGIKSQDFSSRSILYTKLIVRADTIHLIINHWPSRRGGVLAGEYLRRKISLMLREKADSINKITGEGSRIIILGDFNCTPEDQEMKLLSGKSASDNFLVNLSEKQSATGLGTYRYMGNWEMIDQVLVSESLLSPKKGLYTDFNMLSVFKPEFLLVRDPKYPGLSPFSTYKGYMYQGGISDHLPVLLNLALKH